MSFRGTMVNTTQTYRYCIKMVKTVLDKDETKRQTTFFNRWLASLLKFGSIVVVALYVYLRKLELKTLKEELEKMKELLRNKEPLPSPWREVKDDVFSQQTKDQLLEKIRAFEPPGKCKDINLLVIGSIGSGKSSLVNTFTTVLRDNDQIATPAVANENHFASVTSNLHEVVMLQTQETKKLSVFDCPGIKTDVISSGVLEGDLEKTIEGHVMNGYMFSPEHGIQDNNGLYRRHPNISDKMHCVLFVIDAKSLEDERDYPEFRQIKRILALKNIPLRVILTKVDTLDLCIPGDLSGIYKSKQMADKVCLAKDKFGLQESQILPIASYVQETRQNITKDVLALQAVENILNEALGYVKNQVPGLI